MSRQALVIENPHARHLIYVDEIMRVAQSKVVDTQCVTIYMRDGGSVQIEYDFMQLVMQLKALGDQ